jgi:hypothetical protein
MIEELDDCRDGAPQGGRPGFVSAPDRNARSAAAYLPGVPVST